MPDMQHLLLRQTPLGLVQHLPLQHTFSLGQHVPPQ
jgi:hypothetical protein